MNSTEKLDARNLGLQEISDMYDAGKITRAYVVVIDDLGQVHSLEFNSETASS